MEERKKFLSTPSARRATSTSSRHTVLCMISIHALREEGDTAFLLFLKLLRQFLSTPSARRATEKLAGLFVGQDISIHALREEGDDATEYEILKAYNFYPRPPRGGRRPSAAQRSSSSLFLSTPSARRATREVDVAGILVELISIHALREEGDRRRGALTSTSWTFLSTPSARRATDELAFELQEAERFLSTPSARRATVTRYSLSPR